METAGLKLWEVLGQEPRKLIWPHTQLKWCSQMSWANTMAGSPPWARLPQAAQWLPSPADSAPKRGCTDPSSLLRTKFQGAQTLVRPLPDVPERARRARTPEVPLPRVPWGKLASLSLQSHTECANEPCASGCPRVEDRKLLWIITQSRLLGNPVLSFE